MSRVAMAVIMFALGLVAMFLILNSQGQASSILGTTFGQGGRIIRTLQGRQPDGKAR